MNPSENMGFGYEENNSNSLSNKTGIRNYDKDASSTINQKSYSQTTTLKRQDKIAQQFVDETKNRPKGRKILDQPAYKSTNKNDSKIYSDSNVKVHDDSSNPNSGNVPYYATITKNTRISNVDTKTHASTVADDEYIPVTFGTNERKSSTSAAAVNETSESSNKATAALSDEELIQVAITHPSSSGKSSSSAR